MARFVIFPTLLLALVCSGSLLAATAKRTVPIRRSPVVVKKFAPSGAKRSAVRRPVRRTAVRRPVLIAKPLAVVTASNLPELTAPLENLQVSELSDSFLTRRGNLVHQAIDILRPQGDPLLAVTDGVVKKIGVNPLGGLTVYLIDAAGTYCYYYAHLSSYAEGLAEGQAVKQGDTLGYVGDTGNARGGPPHLHFQITRIQGDNWWQGPVVNPYPLLKKAALAAAGDTLPPAADRN